MSLVRFAGTTILVGCCVLLTACGGSHTAALQTSPQPSTSVTPGSASVAGSDVSGKILPGSTLIRSIRLGSTTLVAGAMFGQAAQRAGPRCASGCNPVVWESVGSGWRVALEVPARGRITDERLLAAPFGVLLFNSDEGTALWRSHDGHTWVAQPLPGSMASGVLTSAVLHGRRVEVRIESLRRAHSGHAMWVTTDGRSWKRDR
jgi:hypothetical protein